MLLCISDIESPLFYEQYGNLLSTVQAFHGGFAFRYLPTGMRFTTEFSAVQIMDSIFPNLTSGKPVFDATATVRFNPDLEEDYWKTASYVATLSASEMRAFWKWMVSYADNHNSYQLFQVMLNNWQQQNVSVPSDTCVDYVWGGLRKLIQMGVAFNPAVPLRRDYVVWFTQEFPELIKWNDSTDFQKKDILQFYRTFSLDVMNKVLQLKANKDYAAILQYLRALAQNISNEVFIPAFMYGPNVFYKVKVNSSSEFFQFLYERGGYKNPRIIFDDQHQDNSMTWEIYAIIGYALLFLTCVGLFFFYLGCPKQHTHKPSSANEYAVMVNGSKSSALRAQSSIANLV